MSNGSLTKCPKGHEVFALEGHPIVDGLPVCPSCLFQKYLAIAHTSLQLNEKVTQLLDELNLVKNRGELYPKFPRGQISSIQHYDDAPYTKAEPTVVTGVNVSNKSTSQEDLEVMLKQHETMVAKEESENKQSLNRPPYPYAYTFESNYDKKLIQPERDTGVINNVTIKYTSALMVHINDILRFWVNPLNFKGGRGILLASSHPNLFFTISDNENFSIRFCVNLLGENDVLLLTKKEVTDSKVLFKQIVDFLKEKTTKQVGLRQETNGTSPRLWQVKNSTLAILKSFLTPKCINGGAGKLTITPINGNLLVIDSPGQFKVQVLECLSENPMVSINWHRSNENGLVTSGSIESFGFLSDIDIDMHNAQLGVFLTEMSNAFIKKDTNE